MPYFPLSQRMVTGVPINYHPGAFGFKRRKNYHTGIDIYVSGPCSVTACEPGEIIKIGQFTGGKESPWWKDTWAVSIRGESGICNYGEIENPTHLKVGQRVNECDHLGMITNVIFPERARPDIPGHSIYMLHFERYKEGAQDTLNWSHWHHEGDRIPRDNNLLDPLPFLLQCTGFPHDKFVSWYNPESKEVG